MLTAKLLIDVKLNELATCTLIQHKIGNHGISDVTCVGDALVAELINFYVVSCHIPEPNLP